jgi:hypothetical protein
LFGNDDDDDREVECLLPSQKSSLCTAVSISADSLSLYYNHPHAVPHAHTHAAATAPAVNKGHPMSLTLRCADKSETMSIQIFSDPTNYHVVLHFDGAPLTLTNTPAFYDMDHGDLVDVVHKAGSAATRAAMVPAHAHVHALPSAIPPPALPPLSVAQLMSAAPYINKRTARQHSAAAAKKAQKQFANVAALAVAEKQKAAPKPAKKASV